MFAIFVRNNIFAEKCFLSSAHDASIGFVTQIVKIVFRRRATRWLKSESHRHHRTFRNQFSTSFINIPKAEFIISIEID